MKKSIVTLFDAKAGEFIQKSFYCLSAKQALIAAVMRYNGNFNTWEYPENIEGIYKSNCIKHRLLFDINENLIMYSQEV
jgi:hypothetical protein